MTVVKLRPITPGSRFVQRIKNPQITTDEPYRPLTSSIKKNAGRNNKGRITTRHRGGGHKARYRTIDFKRNVDHVRGKIAEIEYDPNRTALIALVSYENGDKRYIIATEKMRKNDFIENGESSKINEGNCLPLSALPQGTIVCCIEMKPGKGAQMARSAGSYAQILSKVDEKSND